MAAVNGSAHSTGTWNRLFFFPYLFYKRDIFNEDFTSFTVLFGLTKTIGTWISQSYFGVVILRAFPIYRWNQKKFNNENKLLFVGLCNKEKVFRKIKLFRVVKLIYIDYACTRVMVRFFWVTYLIIILWSNNTKCLNTHL